MAKGRAWSSLVESSAVFYSFFLAMLLAFGISKKDRKFQLIESP